MIRHRLSRFISCSTHDLGSVDGDDILQDVFLTFLHRADTFDLDLGDAGIVAWFRLTLKRRFWAMAQRAALSEPLEDWQLEAHADGEPTEAERREDNRDRLVEARGAIRLGTVPVRSHTRPLIDSLFDRVEQVTLGGAEPDRTLGEVAGRVGWSAQQLSNLIGRMRDTLCPEPAAEMAVTASAATGVPALPAEVLHIDLKALPRPGRLASGMPWARQRPLAPGRFDHDVPSLPLARRRATRQRGGGSDLSRASPRGQPATRSAARSALE